MTSLEKLAIAGQALNRPTFQNCYRFWRHVAGCGCIESVVRAAFRSFRQGD